MSSDFGQATGIQKLAPWIMSDAQASRHPDVTKSQDILRLSRMPLGHANQSAELCRRSGRGFARLSRQTGCELMLAGLSRDQRHALQGPPRAGPSMQRAAGKNHYAMNMQGGTAEAYPGRSCQPGRFEHDAPLQRGAAASGRALQTSARVPRSSPTSASKKGRSL